MIDYNRILKADLVEMHKAELAKAATLETTVAQLSTERDAAKMAALQAEANRAETERQLQASFDERAKQIDRILVLEESETLYKKAHDMNAATIATLMKDRDTAALDRELAVKAAASAFDAMQLFRRKLDQVERDSESAVLDAASYSASEHKQAIMNALAKLPKMDEEMRQMILKTVHAVPLRK